MNDEDDAYQKYYKSSIVIPYDADENMRCFEEWDKLSMGLPKPQRALLMMQRLAKQYSPESMDVVAAIREAVRVGNGDDE